MAQQEAKLVSASKSMRNNEHSFWDTPDGKRMYNWDLTVFVASNNGTYKGQCLSTKNDAYPISIGTEIIFETDWVEAHGSFKFKKVKDKAKEAERAQNGGFNKGEKTFDAEAFIRTESYKASIKYLINRSAFTEEIKVDQNQLDGLSKNIATFFADKKDLFQKRDALNLAIDLVQLSVEFNPPITNAAALHEKANYFLLKLKGEAQAQPQQQQAAATQAPAPAPAPAPAQQAATPPPPPTGAGAPIPEAPQANQIPAATPGVQDGSIY